VRETTPKPPKLEVPASEPAKRPSPDASPKASLLKVLRDAGEEFAADAVEHSTVERLDSGGVLRPSPTDRTTIELGWPAIEAAARKAGIAPIKLGKDSEERADKGAASEAKENGTIGEPSTLQTEAAKRALADPDVQAIQERLPGQVREIRNLREYSS
jgi:hypothetical protein